MKSAAVASKKLQNISHYFGDANPFTTVESLSKLISTSLFKTENKDIVVLNKPPNFIFKDKTKDTKGFLDILLENIRKNLNWEKSLRLPIVSE